MTVESPSNTSVHRGNGIATQFPYTFKIPDASFAVVTIQDFETGTVLQTLTPGSYAITGIGWGNTGGYVEYPLTGDPIDDTVNIVLQRIVPYTQGLDLQNQGGFYPESMENQLDLLEMQIQQLAEQVGRTTQAPIGGPGGGLDPTIVQSLEVDWLKVMTLTEYNALGTYDPRTLYLITE